MLVVLSDLHLTDEWTAANVQASAFDRLGERVLDQAGGSRRGAREVEFLLLGDILDLVRTDYWHREGIAANLRPWGGGLSGLLDTDTGMQPDLAAVEGQFAQVLADILARPATRALVGLVRGVATSTGLPARVTYVVGNHDRVLWNFESLRAAVQAAFEPVPVEFVSEAWREPYGVFARHGHEFDGNCHGVDFLSRVLQRGRDVDRFAPAAYRVMAVGEAVTAELMGGLIWGVRQRLDVDDEQDWAFLNALADLNNVRPFTSALHWISWFGQRRGARYLDVCLTAIRDALDSFLCSALVREWDRLGRVELVDALELVRAMLRAPDPLDSIRRLLDLAQRASPALGGGAVHRAEAEREFRATGGRFQYVLYGHTHVGCTDVFEGSADGTVRMYVNTGTWLPLVERARDGRSYYRSHRLTYAFLFAEGERRNGHAHGPGPTFDLWNGMRRTPNGHATVRRS